MRTLLAAFVMFVSTARADLLPGVYALPVMLELRTDAIELPARCYLLRVQVSAEQCDGIFMGRLPEDWICSMWQKDGIHSLDILPRFRGRADYLMVLSLAGFDRQVRFAVRYDDDDKALPPKVIVKVQYYDSAVSDIRELTLDRPVLEESILPKH